MLKVGIHSKWSKLEVISNQVEQWPNMSILTLVSLIYYVVAMIILTL